MPLFEEVILRLAAETVQFNFTIKVLLRLVSHSPISGLPLLFNILPAPKYLWINARNWRLFWIIDQQIIYC